MPSSATSSAAVARWWATASSALSPRAASTGATRAWRRARSAFVSVPYAISWMRSDLKWKSSSSSSTRSRSREPFEQRRRVAAVGELEHRRDRTVGADHRAVFEQRALGRIERVEAGGEQAVQRGRHLADARRVARLLHEGDQLLDEERVAAAALEQQRRELGVGVAVEQRADELAGRLLVERVELERDAVVLAGLGRPAALDVGARGRDEHERPVAQPVEQPFAQVERLVGRPVEVRQHEHERHLLGERFETASAERSASSRGAARVDAGPGRCLRGGSGALR